MAPDPLNIAPCLRPWRAAGVRYLLLDAKTAEALAASAASDCNHPAGLPPRAASVAAPSFRPEPAPDVRPPARPASPPSPRREGSAAPDRPGPAGAGAAPRPAEADALPPVRWAPFWQNLLQKTPSRPSLLWTYPELSRDLSGEADDAHRDFLRRLLGDMALPKGSHAFWPLNSWPPARGAGEDPAGGEAHRVDAHHFLSGIAALNPGTVLLMTGAVPEALGLPRLRLLQPAVVQGRRFVVLPHVDVLIRDAGRYAQLITFLKALLR